MDKKFNYYSLVTKEEKRMHRVIFLFLAFIMLYLVLYIYFAINNIQSNEIVNLIVVIILDPIAIFLAYRIGDIIHNYGFKLKRGPEIVLISFASLVINLFTFIVWHNSFASLFCSYILIVCICCIVNERHLSPSSLIIDIKSTRNAYKDFNGVITYNLNEGKPLKLKLVNTSRKTYKYKCLGIYKWNDITKIRKKIVSDAKPVLHINISKSSENRLEIDEFQILKPGDSILVKIESEDSKELLNKVMGTLGYINQYHIVFEYMVETEKNESQKHSKHSRHLVESILFEDIPQKEEDSGENTNIFNKYSWLIQKIISPLLLSAAISFWITAIYVTFHRWIEFKLDDFADLQVLFNFKDNLNMGLAKLFIIFGFIFMYVSLVITYVKNLIQSENWNKREEFYQKFLIEILEGALLLIPLLTLGSYDFSLQYDNCGYITLNFDIIFSFFLIMVWINFNIIKFITTIYSWLKGEFVENNEKKEFPKTNLLITVISLIVGWILGRK